MEDSELLGFVFVTRQHISHTEKAQTNVKMNACTPRVSFIRNKRFQMELKHL